VVQIQQTTGTLRKNGTKKVLTAVEFLQAPLAMQTRYVPRLYKKGVSRHASSTNKRCSVSPFASMSFECISRQ